MVDRHSNVAQCNPRWLFWRTVQDLWGLHLHANAWAPPNGTNFSKNRVPKTGGRVNFHPSRYCESQRESF